VSSDAWKEQPSNRFVNKASPAAAIEMNCALVSEDEMIKLQSLSMFDLNSWLAVTWSILKTVLAPLVNKVSAPKVQFMYVAESDHANTSDGVVSSRLSSTPKTNEQFLYKLHSPPSCNTFNAAASVSTWMNLMFLKLFLVPVTFSTYASPASSVVWTFAPCWTSLSPQSIPITFILFLLHAIPFAIV
jgi:hypothetical protein